MERCSIVCVLAVVLVFFTSSTVRSEASRATASGQISMTIEPTICPDPAEIYDRQSITFNCTHYGQGANITWQRNGEPLSGELESSRHRSSITLREVPTDWSGSNISCRVDSRAHASTTLTVYSRSPTITISPSNMSVNEGDSFFLRCVTRGLPTPNVEWFKKKNMFGPLLSEEAKPMGNRLTFESATQDIDADVYWCTASNVVNSSRVTVQSALATVEVFTRPTFAIAPTPELALNGSMVRLNCSARGHPLPTITWIHNEMDITSGSRWQILSSGDLSSADLSSGDLVILSVSQADNGIYVCNATNRVGSLLSDGVSLTVQLPPFFLQQPPPKATVDFGREIAFPCLAHGHPLPTYTWLHNGTKIVSDSRVRLENGTLTITKARNDDRGNYTCVAQNGVEEPISSGTMLKVYVPPEPPQFLNITQTGSSWVEIRWSESPVADPPLSGYIVWHCLSFDCEGQRSVETMGIRYNITGLYPSAHYQVWVVAESPVAPGEPSSLINVSTEPGVPKPPLLRYPENITVSSGPRSLTIYWTVPNVLLHTSYNRTRVVVVHPSGKRTQRVSENSPVRVHRLLPYTNYTIELSFFFTGQFLGPSTQVIATTGEDAPADAPNITSIASPDPSNIFLTWTPPTVSNGIIQSYKIHYIPVNHPGEANQTVLGGNRRMWELGGLRPFTNYSVELSASTSVGESPPDVTFIRTNESVPSVAPTELTAIPLSPHSLQLSWKPLADEEVRGELVNYTIRYHRKHHGHRPKFVHIEPNRYMPFNREVAYKLWTVHVLSGLRPFTEYRVKVAGATNRGFGPFTDAFIMATTYGAAPSAVLDMLSVTPECPFSLMVMWKVPNHHDLHASPEEVCYVVKFWRSDEPETVMNRTVNATAMVNGTETYIIEDLMPFTNYSVSIAVSNTNDTGNFSETVQSRTCEGPEVNISSVTPECPSSLVVVWEVPANLSRLFTPPEEVSFIVKFSKSDGSGTAMYLAVNRTVMENETVSTKLEGLQHNTSYDVVVAVKYMNGMGPFGQPMQNSTPVEGVPSAPQNVTVHSRSAHNLTITWSLPSAPRGNPNYTIRYIETSMASTLNVSMWNGTSAAAGQLSVMILGLKPFTEYSVRVAAETTCGQGDYSEPLVERTGEAPSGPPTNVTVVASLPTSIVISWEAPAEPRGNITGYNVSCPSVFAVTVPTSRLSYECGRLRPQESYNITVAAINGAGKGERVTVSSTTACEASEPRVTVSQQSVNVSVVKRSCSIRPLFVLIVVQEQPSTRNISNYTLEELMEETRKYANARQRRQLNEGSIYIAANVTEGQLEGGIPLGDEIEYGGFRNYQLDPDMKYNVGLRSTVAGSETAVYAVGNKTFMIPPGTSSTSAPPTSAPPTSTVTTHPQPSFPLIPVVASAAAAGALFLVIIVVSIIICLCCCCNKKGTDKDTMERTASIRLSSRRKGVDPVDDFRTNHRTEALEEHPPIPVNGFVNKLIVMRTNDNQLFLEEFGSIDMAPQFPTDTANLPCNRTKNRYNNILPYDHSRVKLSSIRGQQGSDYINANYCSGYMKQKAYIATQGPIPETVLDFWRMVWEENSRTIVMLTNTHERGKPKCETYWPRELGSSTVHNHLEVTLISVTQLADYTIRSFTLRKGSSGKDTREVRQFHFTSWPDHGVPQYATAMLAMIRRVRAYHQQGLGPMVVHCSAGVGRTGTFIVIDTMLQRLKHEDHTMDIYAHVTLLRAQRNCMVQTEDQYFFIYEAVAEAIVCGNTEVSLDQLTEYVSELCQVIPQEDEVDTTYIELEFKRLVINKNDPHRFATANRDANKSKNRYVNVLPYETNRVCLEYLRGVDGSDYINASHIDSYHSRRAFIMTQGPLQNTVVDFWRMVAQYNPPVIVMLTQLMEKGTERCVQYWPKEPLSAETYGGVMVEMAVERNSEHYTYRELHVTNNESGQKRMVRHFQFHDWPEVGVPGSPLILMEFIREIQKLHITLNTKAPIVVHCSNGIGRSGVFVALHIIIERMQAEGVVDVFQTVKNLRIQRPATVQTLEQYHFCYDAAAEYVRSSDILLQFRQRSTGSNASELRSSRRSRSRTSSPARNDSFSRPSAHQPLRNRELNRSTGSHIYGGSDATSTFGTQHTNSSPFPSSLNGYTGSQLLPPRDPNQRHSAASNFSTHSAEA